jgi:NACHT domain.
VLELLNCEYWHSTSPSFIALRRVIRSEIVSLYKLLIEYHLRAYYTYCRPLTTISRDILKLDDWNNMIANIKESEKRLEDYMSLNFEQHLLDKLHLLSEDALHKQRMETLLKFKFPDDLPYSVYQAYLDSIVAPQNGTGAGVLTHPKFIKWAMAESGVFVLEGIPGSGKSVLAKSLLTDLPNWRPTTVCAYFFKDNGRGQNAANTALCRILSELFREHPELIDRINTKVENMLPEEVRCRFDLLWSLLEEATRECDPGCFTIVLDGFDECEPDSANKLC